MYITKIARTLYNQLKHFCTRLKSPVVIIVLLNLCHSFLFLCTFFQTLLGLLFPHNTKLREEIEEVLDTELIQQQVENSTLDFPVSSVTMTFT